MKTARMRSTLMTAVTTGVALSAFAVSAIADVTAPAPRIVTGETIELSGAALSTWAKVLPQGRVTEVGFTLPLAFVENPPEEPGAGPDGAWVLNFPAAVQQSTYFNHLEFGWNPHGHEPEGVFDRPHFDFHFEGVPIQDIWNIGFGVDLGNGLFGDPVAPSPERMPAGYVYPGQAALVPFMGVHAFRPEDIVPSDSFTKIMLAGLYNNKMIFIEPMITQDFLLQRQSFTLNIPRPAVLGRATTYPTRFDGIYDRKTDSYYFVFSKFVNVN